MTYKRLGFGLGVLSIAIGVAEVLAPRRIARALGAEEAAGTVRAFGARELAAGGGLLANPAHSALVWGRVAGDAMDLAALSLAAGRDPRNRTVWGAIAFVLGATVLDILTARGLDRETGRALPDEAHGKSGGRATSIEPDDMPTPLAPVVA